MTGSDFKEVGGIHRQGCTEKTSSSDISYRLGEPLDLACVCVLPALAKRSNRAQSSPNSHRQRLHFELLHNELAASSSKLPSK